MSYDFNADEVFEMAEQMERNGAKFYRFNYSIVMVWITEVQIVS